MCFASIGESDEDALAVADAFIHDLGQHQVDGKRAMDVSATCVLGSVDTALSRLEAYARAGVEYLVVGVMPMERDAYLRNIEIIGSKLLPVLNREAASWSA